MPPPISKEQYEQALKKPLTPEQYGKLQSRAGAPAPFSAPDPNAGKVVVHPQSGYLVGSGAASEGWIPKGATVYVDPTPEAMESIGMSPQATDHAKWMLHHNDTGAAPAAPVSVPSKPQLVVPQYTAPAANARSMPPRQAAQSPKPQHLVAGAVANYAPRVGRDPEFDATENGPDYSKQAYLTPGSENGWYHPAPMKPLVRASDYTGEKLYKGGEAIAEAPERVWDFGQAVLQKKQQKHVDESGYEPVDDIDAEQAALKKKYAQ